MTRKVAALDVETFARTALRFAAKRRTLAPGAVETLTGDIVRRLTRISPEQAGTAPFAIEDDSLAAFLAAVIQPRAEVALAFIEARRAEGVTREEVYLGYIAAAARELGDAWDQNRMSLSEVTVGTGHLYALMRALRTETGQPRPAFDARKCALFAAVPGEDHSIGITIAAAMFRDAGWEIDLQLATDHEALMTRVERTRPQVVGLSLTTPGRVPALARLVVAIRLALPNAIIGVAPGATLDASRLDGLLDVDLVLHDAETARSDLERLIKPRR